MELGLPIRSSNLKITIIIGILYINEIYLCESRFTKEDVYTKVIKMPGVIPKKNDDYLCTMISLNSKIEEWIMQFDPLTSSSKADHMLLYGCHSISKKNVAAGYWNCDLQVCEGGKLIYAWSKDAPGIILPTDVGFQIGGDTAINYLALQVHYPQTFSENIRDFSGLNITVTTKRRKFKAGIYLLEAGVASIPPATPETFVDVNCQFAHPEPIKIFGFRMHTHSLGTVVAGYKYKSENQEFIEICRGNPQWPQTFYPLKEIITVKQNNILHARCTYNSSARIEHTSIGRTSTDEMCNLYLMYYTDNEGPDKGICSLEHYKNLTKSVPARSDKPLSFKEYFNEGKAISFEKVITSDTEETTMVDGKLEQTNTYKKDILMPGATPTQKDEYICTAASLNNTEEEWIVLFKPLADADRVHHMMLFACSDVYGRFTSQKIWDCGHHGVCKGGKVIYAWAKNAPATHLPDGVGFRIGNSADIRYLTLQVHYAKPLPKGTKDHSGVQLSLTSTRQQFKAGIFLLASSYVDIPPYTEKTFADINCMVGNTEPVEINIFASRVHTHKLGSVVSGYQYDTKENILTEIVKGNPQWPQAFYKMDPIVKVSPWDVLHARCTFNSSNSIQHTYIGATGDDEMCNLYLMYFTDTEKGSDSGGCSSENYQTISAALPPSSSEPLPPNPILEQMTHGHHDSKVPSPLMDKEMTHNDMPNSSEFTKVEKKSGAREDKKLSGFHLVEDWGPSDYKLGQITAVAVDSRGDVIIFHRGDHVWDGSSFRGDILVNQQTPIKSDTILRLQRTNGKVMDAWGANMFFMPHGLSLDEEDNIWVTDVGLHQVFKFPPSFGNGTPLLSLGKRFQPGDDEEHFCKPTGVAFAKNGDFFVSDGYCNSRIIHYSPIGEIIKQFGQSSSLLGGNFRNPHHFRIPHAITTVPDQQELCVADRENGRVQCFDIDSGAFTKTFKFDEWGRRIFSVCYTSHFGGKLFAVNGPEFRGKKMNQVFEVSYEEGNIIGSFSPFNRGFSNPHDLALSRNGTDLYVVEIGPYKIWKFTTEVVKIKNSTVTQESSGNVTQQINQAARFTKKISAGTSTRTPIFLSLFLVPFTILAVLAIIMRYRRKGIQKWYDDNKMLVSRLNKKFRRAGLNFDQLMPNRRGFQKVSTNDFGEEDFDFDSAGSDVEEFTVAPARA